MAVYGSVNQKGQQMYEKRLQFTSGEGIAN